MEIQGWEMHAVGEPLRRARRTIEEPGPGQVLVEVAGCGVCHTDLGFLDDGVPTRHALPLVLGHEIAGTVVAAGKGAEDLSGQRVLVPAVMPCGSCALCRKGRGDICRRQVFPGNDDHGGFASHVLVPAGGLCRVPPDAAPGEAFPKLSVVADAVSTAYEAVGKSGLAEGDFAVVVGAGGVGSFAVQVASALEARVLAIDVDPDRLALVREHGAAWTIDAREHDAKSLRKTVRGLAKEAGLPPIEWKLFETSGTPAGQQTAFSLLTFGAYLGIVGFHPKSVEVRLSNLMAFAARAEGTWGCLPERFPKILDLVLGGKIAIDPFVETFPMSRIEDVFARLRRHELKRRPVLLPDFD